MILTGTSTNYAAPQTGVNISFISTIDGIIAGQQGLTVDAGSGTIIFGGYVGNDIALASLSASSTAGINSEPSFDRIDGKRSDNHNESTCCHCSRYDIRYNRCRQLPHRRPHLLFQHEITQVLLLIH